MTQTHRGMGAWKKAAIVLVLALGMAGMGEFARIFPARSGRVWAAAPNSKETKYPSARRPDNIVLTPASDMSTSISITWRTSDAVADGVVQFARSDGGDPDRFDDAKASLVALTSDELRLDKTVHCHSATLTGLVPGATYTYRVGSEKRGAWSAYASFATVPKSPEPFTFIYIGDTQVKTKRVGAMLENADKRHPEAAFYMIGGDLVDKGDRRNHWDRLLARTGTVFSRKAVAPAMGNHDFGRDNRGSRIFNAYFSPPDRDPGRGGEVLNYSFRCGDAYFIVMNGVDAGEQSEWLERELRSADAANCAFKIVMSHYPVYNPKRNRNNAGAQRHWVPLFDKYKVDLFLSGHDHSYMRSAPLRAGKPVGAGEFGTTYVVATGCDKFNDFEKLDMAAIQFTNVATYQVITLGADAGGRRALRYASYNSDGEMVDAFETAGP